MSAGTKQVETPAFVVTFSRPSYTVKEWAQACGYGETTIREAEEAGELAFSYANSKPVVTLEEGLRWLRSLPTEKPSGGA